MEMNMNARNSAAAIAAVTLGLGGSALALPPPEVPSAQPRCDIEVVSTPQGTRLRPIARAAADLSGSYRLNVETTGAGGGSSVSQGGDFSLHAGQEQVLGSVSLGHADGTRLVARMDLSWAGGSTHCVRRAQL